MNRKAYSATAALFAALVLVGGLGTAAVGASTQVTRGACNATLSNTSSQATSVGNSSCATGSSSFWVRHRYEAWHNGVPFPVWTSKGYHSGNGVARSPISSPLQKSEHRITNGALPDPGYTYTLNY